MIVGLLPESEITAVIAKTACPQHLYDFIEMAGVEYVQIDKSTDLRALKNELRWNDVAYKVCPPK